MFIDDFFLPGINILASGFKIMGVLHGLRIKVPFNLPFEFPYGTQIRALGFNSPET